MRLRRVTAVTVAASLRPLKCHQWRSAICKRQNLNLSQARPWRFRIDVTALLTNTLC